MSETVGQGGPGNEAAPVRQHVLLACPAYDGKVHAQFLMAAMASLMAFAQARITLTTHVRCGDCHVDTAQNALIKEFLRSQCTDMIIMGSDQGWVGEELVRLCQYPVDIVAGCPPKKEVDGEAFGILIDSDFITSNELGLVKAHMVGSGCLRITRKAAETIAATAPHHADLRDNEPVPMLFERQIHQGLLYSGDNVFCMKAKAAGFDIWVDPEMHFEHVGANVWTGCLGDYWRRQTQPNTEENANEQNVEI